MSSWGFLPFPNALSEFSSSIYWDFLLEDLFDLMSSVVVMTSCTLLLCSIKVCVCVLYSCVLPFECVCCMHVYDLVCACAEEPPVLATSALLSTGVLDPRCHAWVLGIHTQPSCVSSKYLVHRAVSEAHLVRNLKNITLKRILYKLKLCWHENQH